MSRTVEAERWLDVVKTEYLSTFIKDGGSSVKFAVTSEETRPQLLDAVEGLGYELGYLCLRLDSKTVRVHLPQEIFFELARQIDWLALARRAVLGLAKERGYSVERIEPDDDVLVFEAIAAANGLERSFVVGEVRKAIQDRVSKSPEMLRDFREAMRYLCLEEITDQDHPLLLWLRGEARVSAVRDFSIYTRVDRTTARYFIESTLRWVLAAGYTGTALLLDNARVTVPRNPKDGFRYFTKAMATDHYELLREFVDDVDRLAGLFLLVATGEGLLEDQRGTRGFSIYEALKTRVMDDVRDRKHANPVASLVRLQ